MEWVHEEGFCDRATLDKDWVEFGSRLFDGREPVSEYERVTKALTDFFATKTKAELFAGTFERRGLIAPVTTTEELVTSEHPASRGFWEDVDCGEHGVVRFPGAFAKFSAAPRAALPAPAAVGAHTAEVLAELEDPTRPPTIRPARQATVPTAHSPVPGVYTPWVAELETNVTPAGRRSVSSTPVAVSGPLFVTMTVYSIVSPSFGVASSTVFVTARSTLVTVMSAVSESFAAFVSA